MTPEHRRICVYALAFFLVTSVAIFWTRFSNGLALVWPGTAVAAALFLGLPRERWVVPAITIASLSGIATSLFGFGPGPAIPLAIVNVAEAMLTAFLLARLRPQRDYIDNGTGVVAFVLIAGLAVPIMVSGPGGYIAWATVGGAWSGHVLSWIVGHGLGTVLVMPLVLLIQSYNGGQRMPIAGTRRKAEFVGMMALTAAITVGSLVEISFPILFLPIVPLMWASYRFGRFGASIAVLTITGCAGVSMVLGVGALADLDADLTQKVLFAQFYLATLMLISLPLAVAMSQRERLMTEISRREALQRLIADHSDDALLHLDGDGTVRFASPASEGLSGHTDMVGRHMSAFFGGSDAAIVAEALEAARLSPGRTEIVERSVARRHATYWLEAKIRAVHSSSAAGSFVVTVRDVTARKLDELQATREARTDALTGLPNRRAFLDVIERQLSNAVERPFALALVDLDHFKRVNDTHGHDIGDAVLKQIGSLMRERASRNCFFARLGGEEFGIIAMGDAVETAPILCETLRHGIQRHAMADQSGCAFNVTASIGIARIAENCSASMALNSADGPLYAAKASGRNCVRLAHREGSWTEADRAKMTRVGARQASFGV